MKTITHTACLLIGIGLGFPSGQWRGEAMTLRSYAVTQAPGVDPVYVSEVSDSDLARARAPMAVKGKH